MLPGEEMELSRLRAVVESLAKSMDTLVMQNEAMKRQLQVVELQQQLQLQHLQKHQHGRRVARGSKKAASSSGCSSWEFLGDSEQVDSVPSTPGPASTTRWLDQELDFEESNSESGMVWVGCPLPQAIQSNASSASSTAEGVAEERASETALLHLDLEAAAPAIPLGDFEDWSSALESPSGPPKSYGPPPLCQGTTQLTVDTPIPIPFAATSTSSTVEASPTLVQPASPSPTAAASTVPDISAVPATAGAGVPAASTTMMTWPFPFIGSMHGPVTIIVSPPGHGGYPTGPTSVSPASVKEASSSVHHTQMAMSAPSAPATVSVFETALPPALPPVIRPGCCCATPPPRPFHAPQQPMPQSQDAKPSFFDLPVLRPSSSPWTGPPAQPAPAPGVTPGAAPKASALAGETSSLVDIIPPLFPSFGTPCPATISSVTPMPPCTGSQPSKSHLFDSTLFDSKPSWMREEGNDDKKAQPASGRLSGFATAGGTLLSPTGPTASDPAAGLFPALSPFDSEDGLGKDSAAGSSWATPPKLNKLGLFDAAVFTPPSFESWLSSHPLTTPLCAPEEKPDPTPWFGKWTSPGNGATAVGGSGHHHLLPFQSESTFPPPPGPCGLASLPGATPLPEGKGSCPPPLNWVPTLRSKGLAATVPKAKSTEKDWLPPLGLPDCKPLPGLPSPPSPPTCGVFSGPAPLGPTIGKKSTVSRSAWSPQPRNRPHSLSSGAVSETPADASIVDP
mmetsp:Transcript_47335/g.86968  ORF Transcript_47335/g.86968 Transcript_47335/m.86968 type:complete len:735 (+) Transcript_47335:152-2356(+)